MAALCILAACTKTPLEQALIQAGKNRKELEKYWNIIKTTA